MRRRGRGARGPVGDWVVEATVPGGGDYHGRVVGRRAGRVLELRWDVTAGRYVGLGLEAGGAWHVACGEDWEGLGLALLTADGEVRWVSAPGRRRVGRTSLIPGGPGRWERWPATAPSFPFRAVRLLGEGELLEAELAGGPVGRGLALAFAGGHALAWCPVFDQAVVLRYTSGREAGTWEAVWGLGGRPGLAVETLRPRR